MDIPVNRDVLREYICHTPLPLAMERSMEARIYEKLRFARPVLDVGCGEGLFAKMVFGEKIDVGIDPDARELARARELDAYGELIECWGNAIPKPDEIFNTIFSNSVLEHVPEIDPVMREVHRLLSPEGSFYFTVPSAQFEHYSVINRLLVGLGLCARAQAYRKFFNRFWRHFHCYTLEQWRALAERNGFEVVESFTYDPASSCMLNDGLVPFSGPAFVMKRLTNRWTWLPGVRRMLFAPVAAWGNGFLRDKAPAENGGLVFMHVRRRGQI